jgi:hypothetical protein
MSRLDDLISEVWSELDNAKKEIDTMANGKGDLQSMPYIAERCREVVSLIEHYEQQVVN